MQPHAHADGAVDEHSLAVNSRGDGVRRAAERDEEGIALCVHLNAVVIRERGPKETPVFMQRVRVGVTELVQELGGSLDVREQEGNYAGR
jgi:hypothetical protein